MSDPLLADLRLLNEKAAFNRWAGFEVLAARPGFVSLRVRAREDLGQYAGYLHAGIIGALIDTVCGFAAYSQAGAVLAAHYSVNCLAPAVGEAFVAEGRVIKAGRRQIFTAAELFAEMSGERKLAATGETLLMIA